MEEIKEKLLVINADDSGLSDEINKAVRRCFQDSVITGTSIIACGKTYKQSCEMLHVLGKTSVGVHLTLTGSFLPCSPPDSLNSILIDGRFAKDYQALFFKSLADKIDPDEVYREFQSQIEKVKQEGLEISHLDSHEHVHLLPGMLDVVIRLAKQNNIKYIRIPNEPNKIFFKSFSVKDMIRYSGLRAFVAGAKKKIIKSGLVCNDHFWGHFHSGRLTEEILSYIVLHLREGVNELCVHPAFSSEEFLEKYPWYVNATREMEVLVSGTFKKQLSDNNVKLIAQNEVK